MQPVLVAPDLDKEMKIEADVLKYTTERVLYVKIRSGGW